MTEPREPAPVGDGWFCACHVPLTPDGRCGLGQVSECHAYKPDNVVPMPGVSSAIPPGAVCADTVAMLERWLGQAKRGELHGVTLAGIQPNGNAASAWAGKANRNSMLAANTILQARLVEMALDDLD